MFEEDVCVTHELRKGTFDNENLTVGLYKETQKLNKGKVRVTSKKGTFDEKGELTGDGKHSFAQGFYDKEGNLTEGVAVFKEGIFGEGELTVGSYTQKQGKFNKTGELIGEEGAIVLKQGTFDKEENLAKGTHIIKQGTFDNGFHRSGTCSHRDGTFANGKLNGEGKYVVYKNAIFDDKGEILSGEYSIVKGTFANGELKNYEFLRTSLFEDGVESIIKENILGGEELEEDTLSKNISKNKDKRPRSYEIPTRGEEYDNTKKKNEEKSNLRTQVKKEKSAGKSVVKKSKTTNEKGSTPTIMLIKELKKDVANIKSKKEQLELRLRKIEMWLENIRKLENDSNFEKEKAEKNKEQMREEVEELESSYEEITEEIAKVKGKMKLML